MLLNRRLRGCGLPWAHNFFLDTLSSAWHKQCMYQQHCIRETLTSEAGAARVAALMAAESFPSRTAAGRRVCEAFGFRDARGGLQQAGCVKALRVLEAAGRIALPEPLNRGGGRGPRDLGEAIPAAEGVPDRVEAVEGLRLVLVREEGERRRWNGLMAREHPRGAVRHTGAQLRYLIVSAHGTLGGMGFAASALALAARDRWMGWEERTRKRQLHRVVGMSRFLIREGVECRNLASKALGMVLGRLGEDFQQRYGYRPVLVETFVDEGEHAGTSLKASNWIRVGETAGRGRFAATDGKVAVKAIYLYPLAEDWREQLGLVEPEPIQPLGCGEGLDREEWAENELGGARLGDERLSRRLVRSASVQAEAPMGSFSSAAQSDKAMVMGYYRMIDQPADSQVRPENILAPHRARTLRRMQGKEVVLCLQDGTDLNFAEHEGCRGLGLIRKNQSGSGTLGLHMHSTLVVDGEGVPLGVPQIQYEAPEAGGPKRKPAGERKTRRWVEGLRECARLASELEGVRPVSVMDREGDSFELFVEQRRLGTVDLLVRAQHNRRLGRQLPKLFERVRAARAQAGMEIEVGRRSGRRATGQQKAGEKREARLARVGLRWRRVELAPPRNSDFTKEAPVRLNLVHVREDNAPEGVRPLEWFLLTSVGVKSSREAKQVLEWYRLRWRIEDWHRVLKTGCKVEYLGHRSGDRIERAVTIKAVIAWRLMAMTLLGRERPELPAEVLFSDMEILALKDFAQDRRLSLPDNLGATVVTLAMLGGYLNRNNDPPPGHQKIWEGYVRLATMAETYERLIKLNRTSNLYERLRPG